MTRGKGCDLIASMEEVGERLPGVEVALGGVGVPARDTDDALDSDRPRPGSVGGTRRVVSLLLSLENDSRLEFFSFKMESGLGESEEDVVIELGWLESNDSRLLVLEVSSSLECILTGWWKKGEM
jgi:hypothetical protein